MMTRIFEGNWIPARVLGALWVLPLLWLGTLLPGEEVSDYRMRDIPLDDARFVEVLASVNDLRRREAAAAAAKVEGRKIVLLNRLEEGLWLVEIWTRAAVPGAFAQAANRLAGRPTQMIPPRYEGIGALKLKGERADGDTLVLAVVPTETVHRYTTVTGAAGNVRLYRVAADGEQEPDLELPMFIARLKAGDTFLAVKGEWEWRCRDCSGFGKVTAPGGPVPCPACGGKGRAMLPKIWRVMW